MNIIEEMEKRILTTNDAGLIAILLERLIDNFNNSKVYIEKEEYEKLQEVNSSSRNILSELIFQFSGKDNVSSSIREIAIYVNKLITEGEIKKDSSIYDICIRIISPILEGFQQLEIKEKPKAITGVTYGKNDLEEYSLKENKSFKV